MANELDSYKLRKKQRQRDFDQYDSAVKQHLENQRKKVEIPLEELSEQEKRARA